MVLREYHITSDLAVTDSVLELMNDVHPDILVPVGTLTAQTEVIEADA